MTTDLRKQLQTTLGGAYTLERELGGGGMSRVFVAHEPTLDRRVVVKVLPPELAAGVNAERFGREIQLAARLQHPHIVALLSAETKGGLLYYTMPFIEGDSLRAKIVRDGALPVAVAVRLLREIADALAYAHEQGVVHRDIKPENVLISRNHALVTDFGVAKALSSSKGQSGLTSVGLALGTPAYMAPEQAAADESVDHRADIYALGVVGYELLSGRTPFTGATPQQLLAAHVTQKPQRLAELRESLPPALESLIMRCLEKHPADRPQHAHEILDQLEKLSTTSGETAATAALAAARPRNKRRVVTAIGAAALGLAVVAGGLAWKSRAAATDATDARGVRSIAVLPFVNMSGDSAAEFFSDAITDDILTALANVRDLRVTSRTSVMKYKGTTMTVGEVAGELGVATVLEGSVRKSGNRVRITAQLIDAATDRHLWAETFDRELTDIFAVQGEIAKQIARVLDARLSSVELSRITRQKTRSAEAYTQLLLAQEKFLQFNPAANNEGIAAAKRAIQLDPAFAEPYALLSQAVRLRGNYTGDRAWLDSAEALALKATTLDSLSAFSYYALGEAYEASGKSAEALEAHRKALDLSPGISKGGVALTYLNMGQVDEALRNFARSAEEDRDLAWWSAGAAISNIMLGRYAEARRWLDTALVIQPDLRWTHMYGSTLAYAEGRMADGADHTRRMLASGGEAPDVLRAAAARETWGGDLPNARKLAERAVAASAPSDYHSMLTLAMILNRMGDPAALAKAAEAERLLAARWNGRRKTSTAYAYEAMLASMRNDRNAAVERLDSAVAVGWREYYTLAVIPNGPFRELRGHPGYEALMRRVKADMDRMRQKVDRERL